MNTIDRFDILTSKDGTTVLYDGIDDTENVNPLVRISFDCRKGEKKIFVYDSVNRMTPELVSIVAKNLIKEHGLNYAMEFIDVIISNINYNLTEVVTKENLCHSLFEQLCIYTNYDDIKIIDCPHEPILLTPDNRDKIQCDIAMAIKVEGSKEPMVLYLASLLYRLLDSTKKDLNHD
jgi:hypothetical protein